MLGDEPERWRLYTWRAGVVDLHTAVWRSDTAATIQGLTAAAFHGVQNPWARIASQSGEKMRRLQKFAFAHGVLPSCLLIAETATGRFLVDGHHRVSWFKFTSELLGAAFPVSPLAKCYLGKYEEACQPCFS